MNALKAFIHESAKSCDPVAVAAGSGRCEIFWWDGPWEYDALLTLDECRFAWRLIPNGQMRCFKAYLILADRLHPRFDQSAR